MDTDILVHDRHRLKDLEAFGADSAETSLFQFFDLTQNAGGSDVLRRRMEQPWSSVARIRSTQKSIKFIIEQDVAFAAMACAYAPT